VARKPMLIIILQVNRDGARLTSSNAMDQTFVFLSAGSVTRILTALISRMKRTVVCDSAVIFIILLRRDLF